MQCRRAFLLPLASLIMTGCVTPRSFFAPSTPAPSAAPVMLASRWENRVVFPQDTVSGQPSPSLIGKVYLFSEENGKAVPCDGTLRVDLFDVTKLAELELPDTPLERWVFDKDTLKKLQRKDTFGPCYTIPLPWASYRPDIGKVKLQISFMPDKGTPVHASPTAVTLNGGISPPIAQTQRVVPGLIPGDLPTVPMPLQPAPQRSVTRIPITGSR